MSAVRLIGVVHLPALPGSPRASARASEVARSAAADARVLAKAGFDAVVVENFGDAPFFPGRVPAVTVAAMTACALAVREAAPALPLGINVLRNDGDAALAIAATVGAAFLRVNVLTGARVTDQGVIEGDAGALLRQRRALEVPDVALWADVDVKHSAPLAARPIEDEIDDTVGRALADAILVTGEGTGRSVDLGKLERAQKAVRYAGTKRGREVPVYVASGATLEGLVALSTRCDGVIVGSALRAGGVAGGPIDEARALGFAAGFRRAFA